jgi:hypothetical protein
MRTPDKRRQAQPAKGAVRPEPKRHRSGGRGCPVPDHGQATLPANRERLNRSGLLFREHGKLRRPPRLRVPGNGVSRAARRRRTVLRVADGGRSERRAGNRPG